MRPWIALFCCSLTLADAALAHGHGGERPAQRLDKILAQVRHSHPGTFYDAEGPFRGPDGRLHYRLKWLTPQGRMIWFDTDAQSGAVLGEARGPHAHGHEMGNEDGHKRRGDLKAHPGHHR